MFDPCPCGLADPRSASLARQIVVGLWIPADMPGTRAGGTGLVHTWDTGSSGSPDLGWSRPGQGGRHTPPRTPADTSGEESFPALFPWIVAHPEARPAYVEVFIDLDHPVLHRAGRYLLTRGHGVDAVAAAIFQGDAAR